MNGALLREIHAAYEREFWPMRGTFLLGLLACPLTALAIHRGVVDKSDPRLELDDTSNPAFIWACGEFGEDWVMGFMDGFDEHGKNNVEPAYLAGHEFGELALEQLFPREFPF